MDDMSTSCCYAKVKPKYHLSGSGHLGCVTSFGVRVCAIEAAVPPPDGGLRAAVTTVNYDATPPFYIIK